MKVSLWKDIVKYAKTKGTIPLDERQMDTLKSLYLELAKTLILAFITFSIFYGYMELRGVKATFSYLQLTCCLLGPITYYYMLRFCYQDVIGIDSNFEILLCPALLFTPNMLLSNTYLILSLLGIDNVPKEALLILLPVYFILSYLGANLVYKNGKQHQEKEAFRGELHFRSRKQIVNYFVVVVTFISLFPIPYNTILHIFMLGAAALIIATVCYYGFYTPHNEYILNENGIQYHRALWGKKGGFLPYTDIKDVQQQDTFNIGYSKDKVCIYLKNGDKIRLFPENAYQFCIEIKNNLSYEKLR